MREESWILEYMHEGGYLGAVDKEPLRLFSEWNMVIYFSHKIDTILVIIMFCFAINIDKFWGHILLNSKFNFLQILTYFFVKMCTCGDRE